MMIRPLFLAIALTATALPALAQQAPSVPVAGTSQAATPESQIAPADKAAIDKALTKLETALSSGKMDPLADLATGDFSAVSIDGNRATGIDEFAIFWKSLTADDSKQPVKLTAIAVKPDLSTRRYSQLADGTILVETTYKDEYTLASTEATVEVPSDVSHLFIRQSDGSWKISRLTASVSGLSNPLIKRQLTANSRATIGAGLAGILLGFLLGRFTSRRLYASGEAVDANPPKATSSADADSDTQTPPAETPAS